MFIELKMKEEEVELFTKLEELIENIAKLFGSTENFFEYLRKTKLEREVERLERDLENAKRVLKKLEGSI